jgi:kynurenine formamidase
VAAYSLHWGCANLCKGFDAHFDNPFEHQTGCLRLASSKIERFLYYYASKDFSQKEILEVAMIIEEQEAKSFDEGSLSSIIFKATITSWAEMIVKQELCGVSEHQTRELVKAGKNYLKKQQIKLENE